MACYFRFNNSMKLTNSTSHLLFGFFQSVVVNWEQAPEDLITKIDHWTDEENEEKGSHSAEGIG